MVLGLWKRAMLTAFLSAACVLAIMWGVDSGWPWWVFVPLSIGALFFFLADSDEG